MFFEHGVSSTTLAQIAKAAGVTRGAIYWHFADKAELFYAMRDEVQIPLIDRTDSILAEADPALDPLQRVERFLGAIFDHLFNDEATRKTFQIMTFKCEYVGEFSRDLESTCVRCITSCARNSSSSIKRPGNRGLLRPGMTPLSAASDTLIFVSGLIKIWIVDDSGELVRRHAARLVVDHIEAKRAVPAVPKPVARKRKVSRVAAT